MSLVSMKHEVWYPCAIMKNELFLLNDMVSSTHCLYYKIISAFVDYELTWKITFSVAWSKLQILYLHHFET